MLALRRGSRRLELVAQQRGTLNSRRSGRRDDVAVVPADAKSIATSPVWRNPAFRVKPRFVPSSLSYPACEVRAECLLFRDGLLWYPP